MDDKDIIYAAGFVDGEGCIGIIKRVFMDFNRGSPTYNLRVEIANTNEEVLKWFHERFGGSINTYVTLNANHKDMTRWVIGSNIAFKFLKLIQPYCIVKREQIKIAIEFHETKKSFFGSGKTVPIEEMKVREEYYTTMKALNKRGYK